MDFRILNPDINKSSIRANCRRKRNVENWTFFYLLQSYCYPNDIFYWLSELDSMPVFRHDFIVSSLTLYFWYILIRRWDEKFELYYVINIPWIPAITFLLIRNLINLHVDTEPVSAQQLHVWLYFSFIHQNN